MFIRNQTTLLLLFFHLSVFEHAQRVISLKYTVSIYPALFKGLCAQGFLVFNHLPLINPIMSHLNHSRCGSANSSGCEKDRPPRLKSQGFAFTLGSDSRIQSVEVETLPTCLENNRLELPSESMTHCPLLTGMLIAYRNRKGSA